MFEPYATIIDLNGIEIKINSLILITGKFKTGKSATCFFLSEKFIEKGMNVLYIETEGKMHNQSVLQSKHYKFMDNIIQNFDLVKLFYEEKDKGDFTQFFQLLQNEITQKNINLIIIDSYTFPFLSIEGQRSKWFGHTTTKFFVRMLDMAIKYNLCFLIVNQQVRYGNEDFIKGGHNLGYIPNVIIETIKNECGNYSWNWHNFKVPFFIEDDGSITKIG